MKLHRPSMFAGVAASLAAVTAVVLVASSANAFSWPWNRSKPKTVVAVTGSVSCSSVTSLDGYGGNPASLTLRWGGTSTVLPYPFKLRSSKLGVIFRAPSFEGYAARVEVPAGADTTTLSWHLQCRDQTGAPGTSKDGSFQVGRKDMSRTICSYGGPLNPCVDPDLRNQMDACAAEIVTAGMDSAVLDLTKAVSEGREGLRQLFTAALGLALPAAGVVVGCLERQHADAMPAPGTVPAVPTLAPVRPAPVPTLAPVNPGAGQPKTPAPGGAPAPPPVPPSPRISLVQGGAAPAGWWYSVTLSGFGPGSSVVVTCRDSVSPGGFWNQTFSIGGDGRASDSTLCYSADGPDHWVTGGGVESNHVGWGGAPPPPPPAPRIDLAKGGAAPYGWWYSVTLSGFGPGSSVVVTCRDSVSPGGFWNQTFSIGGDGRASDSTLCYSADGPDHWVTGGGVESNHVGW